MSEIQFLGQHENEKVILLLRRHWTVLTGRGVRILLYILIPVLFYLIVPSFFPIILEQPYLGLILFITAIYTLFIWSYITLRIIDYYLDTWIITNERIVDIEQIGLFKRVSSTLHLTKIQDITTEVEGVTPTLLHYGNLYIQTAGEKERVSMERISHPGKVKSIIMNLYKNAMREKSFPTSKEPTPSEKISQELSPSEKTTLTENQKTTQE